MKKISICLMCGLIMLIMAGCHLSHEWEEATCVNAKICNVCGMVEGEPLGHEWEEATCVEAKTCSVCNAIEGIPLGHSTEIGTCDICFEKQGADIINEIIVVLDEANVYWELGLEIQTGSNATTYSDLYKALSNGISYYEKVKECLEEAISLCANYEELKDLKNALQGAVNDVPLTIAGQDKSSLEAYQQKLYLYLEKAVAYQLEVIKLQELIK